jgi:hypothetical protein
MLHHLGGHCRGDGRMRRWTIGRAIRRPCDDNDLRPAEQFEHFARDGPAILDHTEETDDYDDNLNIDYDASRNDEGDNKYDRA